MNKDDKRQIKTKAKRKDQFKDTTDKHKSSTPRPGVIKINVVQTWPESKAARQQGKKNIS